MDVRRNLQGLLGFEVVLYLLPSLIHRGLLIEGHQHAQAAIAETVISIVLLVGLIGTLIRPQQLRAIGLTVQAFALLGTLVGAAMIAIGVGPQSAMDLAIHALMLATLLFGIARFWRYRTSIA